MGALSIVRFRTVVRDTEDTAFVIFAVIIGMAVGGNNLPVALTGIVVVTAAAFWMRPKRTNGTSSDEFVLNLRLSLGKDLRVADRADADVTAERPPNVVGRHGKARDSRLMRPTWCE